MKWWLLFGFCSLSLWVLAQPKPTVVLKKDSIKSKLDGNIQRVYYFKSTAQRPQPLVVQLHSWSYPADSLKTMEFEVEAISKNLNYIFPNFRGINNHIKACCSEYVISAIDEAIDWAIKNMKVDKRRIYVVGVSGGGYATLAMYMKSRHNISAFSAWVPISDLERWYLESTERKNKYAADIIACTNEVGTFDVLKARERSPLHWATPVKKRKKSIIQIFAGIHDGLVPISHSVNFYNKLLTDIGVSDSSKYVSTRELLEMTDHQTFGKSPRLTIGDRAIYYQKQTKLLMLTIFEGGHEMLSNEVLDYIAQMNGSR